MHTPDEFTGERFLPQCSGEIWAEHWHRYLFAAAHVAGRDVLDAACGEGYGAALLARRARSVTGLDIDGPTVAAARAKYAMPALRFEAGSVTAMPFADASFDCVVSFETLEHLAEQQAMLAEMRRVLRPHGVLIISTPNRVEYSDKRDFHNEFHVRELSEDEFRALLGGHFGAQRWYGQRLVFNSALWPLPAATGALTDTGAGWVTVDAADRILPAPMYFVAFAAADPSLLPAVARTTLLADPDDTMYRDYVRTVAREATLERLVDERDSQLSAQHERMRKFEALIVERDRQLTALAARAETMEQLIAEREQLIVKRDSQIAAGNQARIERERLITERDGQLAALNARIRVAEDHIAERERLVVERDAQLAAAAGRMTAAEGLLAERERIIVERDTQLGAVNARTASLEGLVADRERIIVERDGQLAEANRRIAAAEALIVERDALLAATNSRMAVAEVVIAERDGRLLELGRRIEAADQEVALRAQRLVKSAAEVAALEDANRVLRDEVARRAGWRWWLALPFLRIRWMLSPAARASKQGRP